VTSSERTSKYASGAHSEEKLARARELYAVGKSLQAVSREVGIPYSTLRYHAWVRGWGVRNRGKKRDVREDRRRAKELARRVQREEARMLFEESLAKGERLEVMARGVLIRESERAKLGYRG